jgi:exodeoxyribonuclease VIII
MNMKHNRTECVIGLDAATYHADSEAVSKHGLDLINRAPALYRHRLDNPQREQTPAQRFGTLAHTIVLEEARFHESVALAPKVDRRTKAGREQWDEFTAAHPGKEIITEEEFREFVALRDAIRAHPAASSALEHASAIEPSLYWTDVDTGVACRARPDLVRRDGIVVDLKTAQDASAGSFAREAIKYRYHVQAAFYLDALRAIEWEADAFVFVVVEKAAPHLVQVFAADADFLNAGRAAYKADLLRYKSCREKNEWPGYSPDVLPLGLPGWMKNN